VSKDAPRRKGSGTLKYTVFDGGDGGKGGGEKERGRVVEKKKGQLNFFQKGLLFN